MNKKLFIGLFLTLGLMLGISCSKEDPNTDVNGEEAVVSFSLGIQNDMNTRAISDGTGADKLVYSIFDSEGNRITQLPQVIKTVASFPTTEQIRLTKGQTYKIAFWAQNSACTAYTVSDDMKVAVNHTGVNNDESRDAFFASVTFTVGQDENINVVLKRPFAQLNVGITTDDWNAAVASGISITRSKVNVSNVANSINLLDGSVEGTGTMAYALANIPTETLVTDANGDGTAESYKYLSMSYLLADAVGKTTLNTVSFEFVTADGAVVDFSEGLSNVPVQRNWRTNIVGSILTDQVEFTISIDPIYEGDHNIMLVTSKADFLAAVNKLNASGEDGTIRLGADVEWATGNAGGGANMMFSNAGTTITIEGDGNKLIATGQGGIKNNADMIFNNVEIVDQTAYWAESGETAWEFTYLEFQGVGNYIFNDCVFNNSVMFQGTSTEVNNGNFKGIATLATNQSNEYCAWVYNGTATFTDCYFSNGYRGLKVCDMYAGSDVTNAVIDNCKFENLSKKPGIAIDNRLGELTVTIKNSTFTNTQPGDQGNYIYETDNVVPTLENNTVN